MDTFSIEIGYYGTEMIVKSSPAGKLAITERIPTSKPMWKDYTEGKLSQENLRNEFNSLFKQYL